jgi:uncharacterized membrane protein
MAIVKTPSSSQRIAYLDWLRGLACVLMFQTHCYDSWLGGAARQGAFIGWSRLLGGLPAPLFLFLAGVSTALLMDRMSRKGVSADEIAHRVIRRGVEIFALGLLFRLQEYILGWGYSPWTDFLRVDILNTIGLSIVFLGVVGRIAESTKAKAMLAAAVALGIAMATPPLWTTHAPRWLPWFLESYINGVHNFGQPQPWLFPIFPWTAFAFAGMAAGLWLWHDWAMEDEARPVALLAALGVGMFLVSWWFETRPQYLYAVYDYWHTSPNFFLARVGIILVIVLGAYMWCRWGAGQIGFSPLIQLGQTSLLVYWVHIEFVYGGLSILTKRAQTIPRATFGLLVITVAMVLLSMARTRWKGHGAEIFARFRSGQLDEIKGQSAAAG